MEQNDLQLSFPRKYRPGDLAGYIGNEKAKRSVITAINSDRKPQVLLLAGASGCGKTTFARIIAREYSCPHRTVEKGACGICEICQMFDRYVSTGKDDEMQNITEVDVSLERGISKLEGVIQDMQFPAYDDEWKIYIFDEFHKATETTQNALLKVTEEPPEHILIMFCTTNPEEMIAPLRNRCNLQLVIKKPTTEDLRKRLEYIAKCEGFSYDIRGLNFVIQRSGNVIREALIKCEQVYNEAGCVTFEAALSVFEMVSDEILFSFFNTLLTGDQLAYVTTLHKIKAEFGLQQFVSDLEDFVKRGIYIINNANVEGLTSTELKSYQTLFARFSATQLVSLLRTILDFRVGDTETKLLLLGYSGLASSIGDKNVNLFEEVSSIKTIPNEVGKESKQAFENKKEKQKLQEDASLARADELNQPAKTEDIMSLFNAVKVE